MIYLADLAWKEMRTIGCGRLLVLCGTPGTAVKASKTTL